MASFDPSEPRDESGKWTAGGGGAVAAVSSKVRSAVDYVKSGAAQRAIGSVITEGRVKAAASVAIQGLVNHVGQFNDPIADEYVEHLVHGFQDHAKMTTVMAREKMIAAMNAMIEARRAHLNEQRRAPYY